MFSAWAKRRVGVIAGLVATLIFATPLLCALHSIHAAPSDVSSSSEPTAVRAMEEHTSHHHHNAEELCQAGAAITAPLTGLRVRGVSTPLRFNAPSYASRAPEVPKPVPIRAPSFHA